MNAREASHLHSIITHVNDILSLKTFDDFNNYILQLIEIINTESYELFCLNDRFYPIFREYEELIILLGLKYENLTEDNYIASCNEFIPFARILDNIDEDKI